MGLPPGKLPPGLLREILAECDPPPPELLVPPRVGEDACVIELPGGALVAASDPITLTGRGIGELSVTINANDVAVMGARPRWFLSTVLLPDGTDEAAVRALFGEMRAGLRALGATLVGGHTEVTEAVTQPVVVGQMLGLREDGGFVRTGGMRAGDRVLQIGRAPVEGAAVLAHEARDRLGGVDAALMAEAERAIESPGVSVVAPALRCAELGASAMHDPTEGGLSSGLHELAEASALSLVGLSDDRVLWFEPGRALGLALGADPWGVLASGCLLAAFDEAGAADAITALRAEGFEVAEIARAENGEGVWREDGEALPRFDRDELSRVL
jgi:hydrogenase maturation factor